MRRKNRLRTSYCIDRPRVSLCTVCVISGLAHHLCQQLAIQERVRMVDLLFVIMIPNQHDGYAW